MKKIGDESFSEIYEEYCRLNEQIYNIESFILNNDLNQLLLKRIQLKNELLEKYGLKVSCYSILE